MALGSRSVRDIGLLESALARPFATFDDNDLYPTAVEKASAILERVKLGYSRLAQMCIQSKVCDF
ncbi:prophage maintenance system killer protein [Pedobacter sp. UYP30]